MTSPDLSRPHGSDYWQRGVLPAIPEREVIRTPGPLHDFRPILQRKQKELAIAKLRELFSSPEFQDECARVCKDAGSKFRLADLKSELKKAGDIFTHYLGELEQGKHDYARIKRDDNNIELCQPYGRIVGFTAPNYPIGENAAVVGVLNAILAGCPMDLRMGAGSTKEIDLFMADRVIAALADPEIGVPENFIGKVEINHGNSDRILSRYAGIFFIGGTTGLELLKHTQYQVGNLQTGRPNWMVVEKGAEQGAAKLLASQAGSRFGLSCSGTSIVFLEGGADELVHALHLTGNQVKDRLLEEGESPVADKRFMKSLHEARDLLVRGGGRCQSSDQDYLTLVTIDAPSFRTLRDSNGVPEVFGPGFLIVENCSVPFVDRVSILEQGDLRLLSPAKTGIVVSTDVDRGECLAAACAIQRLATRISINTGSSTPAPGVGYLHCNPDGHWTERQHIIEPTAFLMPGVTFNPSHGWTIEQRNQWD